MVLYKLFIIKIYLCTKDFFCLFLFYFFFFFNLMGWRCVHGVNGGRRAYSALVASKPLEVERKCQRWKRECRAECWVPHQHVLRGHLLGLHKGRGGGRASRSDRENPLRKISKVHSEQIDLRTLELVVTHSARSLTCHS